MRARCNCGAVVVCFLIKHCAHGKYILNVEYVNFEFIDERGTGWR